MGIDSFESESHGESSSLFDFADNKPCAAPPIEPKILTIRMKVARLSLISSCSSLACFFFLSRPSLSYTSPKNAFELDALSKYALRRLAICTKCGEVSSRCLPSSQRSRVFKAIVVTGGCCRPSSRARNSGAIKFSIGSITEGSVNSNCNTDASSSPENRLVSCKTSRKNSRNSATTCSTSAESRLPKYPLRSAALTIVPMSL